jgi:hypothetical protein
MAGFLISQKFEVASFRHDRVSSSGQRQASSTDFAPDRAAAWLLYPLHRNSGIAATERQRMASGLLHQNPQSLPAPAKVQRQGMRISYVDVRVPVGTELTRSPGVPTAWMYSLEVAHWIKSVQLRSLANLLEQPSPKPRASWRRLGYQRLETERMQRRLLRGAAIVASIHRPHLPSLYKSRSR